MIKFNLIDGKIKFVTHKIEWTFNSKKANKEINGIEEQIYQFEKDFYTEEEKNIFIGKLGPQPYTVIEYSLPTQEQIDKVAEKKFNTIEEAEIFINSGIEKITLESLAEIVADIIGGAL